MVVSPELRLGGAHVVLAAWHRPLAEGFVLERLVGRRGVPHRRLQGPVQGVVGALLLNPPLVHPGVGDPALVPALPRERDGHGEFHHGRRRGLVARANRQRAHRVQEGGEVLGRVDRVAVDRVAREGSALQRVEDAPPGLPRDRGAAVAQAVLPRPAAGLARRHRVRRARRGRRRRGIRQDGVLRLVDLRRRLPTGDHSVLRRIVLRHAVPPVQAVLVRGQVVGRGRRVHRRPAITLDGGVAALGDRQIHHRQGRRVRRCHPPLPYPRGETDERAIEEDNGEEEDQSQQQLPWKKPIT
mmetsp:Transcript_11634/g.32247  ORF Transcript_11634/g.32247 Transcript_11634/m.32247 type:complete len:298 (-) Transcript_11634:164-1057(-)